MPTADQRLALIWPKVERAKKYILDLEAAIAAFRKTDPYTVGTKRDPQTRKLVYYMTRVDPVPLDIAAISGDVVHNLRGALDYLHQHLFMIGTGTSAPSKDLAFYIDGDPNPNHYKTSAPAKVQGLDLLLARAKSSLVISIKPDIANLGDDFGLDTLCNVSALGAVAHRNRLQIT